jgi:ABC-2 type transport system permease protein
MLKVIALLIKLDVKSRLEYRGAFLVDIFAMMLTYTSVYATIWVLLLKFNSLGGWDWPELALLLSYQLFTYSIGASFSFVQFRNMEELVRLGQFDALLVKPFSPWAYMTFSGLNIGYTGHIIVAVGLMVWAIGQVDVAWNAGLVLYAVASVISAAMVVAAFMTMIGASAIVLVQSSHLYAIFFGFWELSRFPLNIYPAALQWAMLTVLPLGYMSYVPAAVLLGKDVAVLGPLAGPASLLAGPLSVLLAMAHWRYCVRHYQGGGG